MCTWVYFWLFYSSGLFMCQCHTVLTLECFNMWYIAIFWLVSFLLQYIPIFAPLCFYINFSVKNYFGVDAAHWVQLKPITLARCSAWVQFPAGTPGDTVEDGLNAWSLLPIWGFLALACASPDTWQPLREWVWSLPFKQITVTTIYELSVLLLILWIVYIYAYIYM